MMQCGEVVRIEPTRRSRRQPSDDEVERGRRRRCPSPGTRRGTDRSATCRCRAARSACDSPSVASSLARLEVTRERRVVQRASDVDRRERAVGVDRRGRSSVHHCCGTCAPRARLAASVSRCVHNAASRARRERATRCSGAGASATSPDRRAAPGADTGSRAPSPRRSCAPACRSRAGTRPRRRGTRPEDRARTPPSTAGRSDRRAGSTRRVRAQANPLSVHDIVMLLSVRSRSPLQHLDRPLDVVDGFVGVESLPVVQVEERERGRQEQREAHEPCAFGGDSASMPSCATVRRTRPREAA